MFVDTPTRVPAVGLVNLPIQLSLTKRKPTKGIGQSCGLSYMHPLLVKIFLKGYLEKVYRHSCKKIPGWLGPVIIIIDTLS